MKVLTGAGIALLALSTLSWADTLVLRNGREVDGVLLSATRDTVKFRTEQGMMRVFNRVNVRSIEFNNRGMASAYGAPYGPQAYAPYRDGYGEPPAGQYPNARIYTDENGRARGYYVENTVPAGAVIDIRTEEPIVGGERIVGERFPGVVARPVVNEYGQVIIPRGAHATLVVRSIHERGVRSPEMVVDLESIRINGRRYYVTAAPAIESSQTGLGANRRTAKYVGGGAALGTAIGAIAGGGKGAAIGALSGAAVGATAQVVTRGHEIDIPPETVLTFPLERPLQLVPEK